MTKEEILAMEAGAKLDDLVATDVMGWERVDSVPYECRINHQHWYHKETSCYSCWRSHYSTDISAAWQVVEKMIGLGFRPSLEWAQPPRWICKLWKGICLEMGEAREAPEAICKAALLAKLEAGST